MTTRTTEEVITEIHNILETRIKPAVSHHGGAVNYVSFNDVGGVLLLEMAGACSGCAGATQTLKMGVERLIKHAIPEVVTIESQDQENSGVDPYYQKDIINVIDIK
tara:strand:+ start:97 stop:414 length:318 start_codon:yes stop_codon:yes gene_type:complete